MPPGNLISTLKDVSIYYATPENAIFDDSDDGWTILGDLDDQEYGAGAGLEVDRSQNIEYPVRPGETLSEIAYAYGIPYDFLAWYNKISNANRIRVGTVIIIPSLENTEKGKIEYAQHKARLTPTRAATTTSRNIKDIQIGYESRVTGDIRESGVTIHFHIINPPANLRSYEWEMGDGRRSFREDPSYEYSVPKTYVVRLTAQGSDGTIYKSKALYIDIPHPSSVEDQNTVKFITISAPDDYFVIDGTITSVAGYANVSASPLDLSESDRFLTKVRFKKPGYYGLTVYKEGYKEQYYSIFVSPIATMHADTALETFNWYRTQFNTGTPSNCGPASVSMAIGWGVSKYYPVSSVRETVGWQGEGGTSFEELLGVIKSQGVSAYVAPLRSVQNVRDVIDSGGIAIILYHTGGIRATRSSAAADLFGKYYNDSVGHYSVIKGYSLNDEYFVIHDPIPSDWGANSFRHGDEISMIGRNRYYSSAEVLRCLRRTEMIVVNRAN
jgi:murein DD-endopeptidase MepM/ murein hydrolase activator NlpD